MAYDVTDYIFAWNRMHAFSAVDILPKLVWAWHLLLCLYGSACAAAHEQQPAELTHTSSWPWPLDVLFTPLLHIWFCLHCEHGFRLLPYHCAQVHPRVCTHASVASGLHHENRISHC
jgi:hypothetical protein